MEEREINSSDNAQQGKRRVVTASTNEGRGKRHKRLPPSA